MNIAWHTFERVFIAEFSSDFRGDLDAVKAAGFRPLGVPPPWIWHAPAPGVKALNRLRENRPASGLTITPEALEIYKPLAELEARNEEVRKQLAEQKKKAKKEQRKKEEETAVKLVQEGPIWIELENLPTGPLYVSSFTAPLPPDLKCHVCLQPVYFYELQSPPTCLWCESLLDLSQASKNNA